MNKEQPVVKIKKEPIDYFLEYGALILLVAIWGFTIYHFNKLPDIIADGFFSAMTGNLTRRTREPLGMPVPNVLLPYKYSDIKYGAMKFTEIIPISALQMHFSALNLPVQRQHQPLTDEHFPKF
jgi:hypothetical protein